MDLRNPRLTPTRTHGTLMRATIWVLASIACANTASLARSPSSQADDTRIATLRVLDDAVRGLGRVDADGQQVVRDAIARLPSNADSRVRTQLGTFLARIPQPGAAFPCSDVFIRARAEQQLWRLRDVVLDIQTRPIEPSVCYAVPFAVDLMRARTTASVVDIYGYDFDATSLQLVVVTPDGFVDVTPSLVVASHTHLTVRVGENGVSTTATNQALGLAWGHVIHYRVPLVGPTTHICSSRAETIPAGRTVRYTDSLGITSRREADRTDATMHLDYSSNLVQAVLCVTAANAAASGCFSEFLYTTDSERVIEGVLGPISSQISLPRGHWPLSVRVQRGLVRHWSAAGSPSNSVTIDSASIVAQLDSIKVVSTNAEACLSPIAYAEAKRATAFSVETRQLLDAELRRVDRAIVKLRPRFAPPGALPLTK